MLSTVKIILSLLPLILQLIKAVEVAIPENGKGKEKLAFVHDVLAEAFPAIQEIWDIVERIVASAVQLYNATGVFEKIRERDEHTLPDPTL